MAAVADCSASNVPTLARQRAHKNEIGKVQGKETAFEQAAIFEFFCHLAIERCEGAHDVLRLRVSYAACFFLDVLGAFQKALSSKTEIHSATHSNSRTLVR